MNQLKVEFCQVKMTKRMILIKLNLACFNTARIFNMNKSFAPEKLMSGFP
jgi:hypothetical protein